MSKLLLTFPNLPCNTGAEDPGDPSFSIERKRCRAARDYIRRIVRGNKVLLAIAKKFPLEARVVRDNVVILPAGYDEMFPPILLIGNDGSMYVDYKGMSVSQSSELEDFKLWFEDIISFELQMSSYYSDDELDDET